MRRPSLLLTALMAAAMLLPPVTRAAESSNVVYRCDFESADWWKDWGHRGQPARTDLVASDGDHAFEAHDGKALRVRIDRGGHDGLSAQLKLKRILGEEPEELYFRYYLRLGDDWAPADGGKLPGFSGTYDRSGWGGRRVDGTDGWSARGLFRPPVMGKTPTGFYCYHVDMRGQYGSDWKWLEDGLGNLEKNRWYCLEHYVKMNTPGKNDGILRGWVDGKPAFEKTDIRFRDVPSLKVEAVWLCIYHGGGTPSPTDQHLFIDDLVVSRAYIGPR